MKPTILITGGAGYIGSHTAYLMYQKGYEIIILDTFLHNQQFNPSWATVIKKDFANTKILEAIFTSHNITAVMHLAALIDVGESIKNPLLYYDTNIAKTVQLLNLMIKHDIHTFIFSSSCSIYGQPFSLPLTEDLPKNPISPFGKSKLMIEMMLEDLKTAYGMSYISLRYFNAAGAMPQYGLGEQHTPETHIIPVILRAAIEEKPFHIFGIDYQTKDGSCIRDFTHVWDIAYAHSLALEYLQQGNPSDCFNLGTGKGFSVKQIIRSVKKTCGLKTKILHTKRRKGDPPVLIANPQKAFDVLQWQPKHSDLDTIIKSAYEFECSKKANFRSILNENQLNSDNLNT